MADDIKYPVGIQSFPEVIGGGYLYVDKTGFIKKLEEKGKYYFLSRPRRFGKSLFLSTLESLFLGKRELFRGLTIDADDRDWSPRPVVKMSLNIVDPKSDSSLANLLNTIFRSYEEKYCIPNHGDELASRFEMILKTACELTGRKVAVLIDEYDAPLLNTLDDTALNESYRATLRAVFSVLKNADDYIHFAFVTGVSRFSHASLFSGANHLKDISLDDRYAAICGITEPELKTVLMPCVSEFAREIEVSDEILLSRLKENYDGYHFSKNCPDIYNPFSLLNALDSRNISNYWFESGTPRYLLSVLKRDNFFLPELDCLEAAQSDLSAEESYMQNPVALLYESGYVTIKQYDDDALTFTLGMPNQEVATSFAKALMPIYSGWEENYCRRSSAGMRKSLAEGDTDRFMRMLQTFLEGNPYGNTVMAQRETYFKNNIFIVLKALGFMPRVEEQTCRARMDVMLRTRRYIYIFELKTDGDTGDAMHQIEDRGYTLPYADEARTVIRIAANYSTRRNNIDSWIVM